MLECIFNICKIREIILIENKSVNIHTYIGVFLPHPSQSYRRYQQLLSLKTFEIQMPLFARYPTHFEKVIRSLGSIHYCLP